MVNYSRNDLIPSSRSRKDKLAAKMRFELLRLVQMANELLRENENSVRKK